MRHHWNEFVSEPATPSADGGFTSTKDEQRALALLEEMNEHAARCSDGTETALGAPVSPSRIDDAASDDKAA